MNREGQFEVEIKPREKYRHTVQVQQPGDTVSWTFATRKKNIAFGLFYQYQPGGKQTLLSAVSLESLELARKSSVLLRRTPSEAALSSEFVHEVLQACQPLVHIRPPPKQQAASPALRSSTDLLPTAAKRERNHSAESLGMHGGELIEIVPVERYSSAETTVAGSIDAPLAGTYVLLFDNSFSMGTSKQLTVCVAVRRTCHDPAPSAVASTAVVHGGWLLKRKRLRMQGFAKRWFKLDSAGLLTYHDNPEGSVKGGLNVRMSVITKVPPRLLITLDSGNELFHLKALTDADYKCWCDKIAVVVANVHPGPAGAKAGTGDQLAGRIREHRVTCTRLMDELRAAGSQDTSPAVVQHLTRLERTFAALSALYADLMLLADRSAPADDVADEEDVFYDVHEEIVIDGDSEAEEYAIGVGADESAESMSATGIPSETPSVAPSLEDAEAEQVGLQLAAGAGIVRSALPARATPITISFSQMAWKQSIGRSAGAATTPVVLNEPLSGLQRQCEELEYSELLDAAGAAADPVERLSYLAAFAVSAYASCIHRYEYKPFTPMLGETFEHLDPARRLRFVAEKVEHQPETILACYAESTEGRWRWWQELRVKTKMWGKTVELTPGGFTHAALPDPRAPGQWVVYRWNKVTSCSRNVLSKDVFIDNFGEMLLSCNSPAYAQHYAKLEFVKSGSGGEGMFGMGTAQRTGRNEVAGAIVSAPSKAPVSRISGRWDDYVAVDGKMLWKAQAPPGNSRDFYGFSLFAMQLNVPPAAGCTVPPTDSRLRPDQRLVEDGEIDRADEEKARLEQQQRAQRAARLERGEPWVPLWFSQNDDGEWVFDNRYFDEKSGGFESIEFPSLW